MMRTKILKKNIIKYGRVRQIDSLNISNKDKIFDKYNFLENDELKLKKC